MTTRLTLLQDANRLVLEALDARRQELVARETELHGELETVANELRRVAADRETITRAQEIHEIHARLLQPLVDGVRVADAIEPARPAGPAVQKAELSHRQSKARIGPQRYAMLTTLRARPRLTQEEIASATGLAMTRVKEQMRADLPVYVECNNEQFFLTDLGQDLLHRFENYRLSQGKPLPSWKPGDADEPEKDEAADPNSPEGESAASITDANGVSDPPRA